MEVIKMKIVELVCKPNGQNVPQVYTVGNYPLNLQGTQVETIGLVAAIRYNRLPYNKGFQGDFPSYTIEFEDSDIRVIVPESEMVRTGIDIEKGKKDDVETMAPPLPDDEPVY
jgi:hypothetical protein